MSTVRALGSVVVCLGILGCASGERYYALQPETGQVQEQLVTAQAAALRSPAGSSAPTAAVPVADSAAGSITPPAQRIIIYSGFVQLVVADVARTLESIRARAIAAGGYMQEMDGSSITIRIPAGRFYEISTWVLNLGEVTTKQIRSQDVTEEMRDLRIRLDNAEQTRKRLLAILEKTAKMEDALKVEVELERVTQTIELLKGKIQAIEQQVAYSVLKVQLNSPLPQRQVVAQIPFEWVRRLGEGVVAGVAAQEAQSSRRDRRAIRFDPPKSYIRYYDRDETSEAMSADGILIKIQKHENYKGGDLAFWAGLARRALVEMRSVAIGREETIAVQDKVPARLMVGTRDMAGQKSGYLLAIVVREEVVYAFEAWGPAAVFEKELPAIESSVKSLEACR